MSADFIWVLACLLPFLGLGAGWVLWARPLAAASSELTSRREALARAESEAATARTHSAEAERLRHESMQLATELSGLKAAQSERERAQAEALAERDRVHADHLARLESHFQRLAADALAQAQSRFTEQAAETLKLHRAEAQKGLNENHLALAELVAPMRDTLGRYESELKRIEQDRVGSYESLRQMLGSLGTEQARSREAVTRLETALRSSGKVAGRWGEEQCRNVLEAAGLVEGIDFEAQVAAGSDHGGTGERAQFRPDFVLNLPGGRALVIDVKCSIDSYLEAVQTDEPAIRTTRLVQHARQLRTHASSLASKDYSKAVASAVDFVVMFVPGENFLAAAFEHDRSLLSDFFNKRVVLAGPVNLVAVARTVAAMRDQARLAQEAAEIAKVGRDLYESLRIMGGNILSVQKSLDQTVSNFNKMVSQIDQRVVSRARRFEKLGAATGLQPIPEISGVDRLALGSRVLPAAAVD